MLFSHIEIMLKCNNCLIFRFSTAILLRAHLRRIHDVGSGGRLVCKICNKELKDERNLKEHSKIHTGE